MNAPMETTKVVIPSRFSEAQRAEMGMTEFYVTRINTPSESSKNYVVGLNRNDEGAWQSVLLAKAVVAKYDVRAGTKIFAEFYANFGSAETSYKKVVTDANGNETTVTVQKSDPTQQIQFSGRIDFEQPTWDALEPADFGI